MSNRSFFKEIITGGRTKRKERVQSIDRLEAGPREGIRKGNLRVSKSRHNTLSKNENMTYKGQKDGVPGGLIDGSNEFTIRGG